MQALTTNCSKFGHPEFRLVWSNASIPAQDAAWLICLLEARVRDGDRFDDGAMLQIGWMFTRIRSIGNYCEIQEPDFKNFPIQWVTGVDRTLRDFRRQTDVLESLEPQPQPSFPSILQAGYVCQNFDRKKSLVIERAEPKNRFSGWFITCDDPQDRHAVSDLKLISLYEVALRVPGVMQFLALPSGSAGKVSMTFAELYEGDRRFDIKIGSYLFALHSKNRNRSPDGDFGTGRDELGSSFS